MKVHKSKREVIREKRKQQKRRRLMMFLIVSITAIILLGFAIILPKFLIGDTKYKNTNRFSVGDKNAPITVVEFSSYSCGYCKNFSENYEKDFISEYVDTGNVYYTYVNLPANSEQSLAASEASYCAADQNKFFEFKDLLYTNAGYSDSYSTSNLIQYATTAGLDEEKFQTCLASDKYAESFLEDYDYASSVGLSGTPSFLVNGITLVYSNELMTIIESLIEK